MRKSIHDSQSNSRTEALGCGGFLLQHRRRAVVRADVVDLERQLRRTPRAAAGNGHRPGRRARYRLRLGAVAASPALAALLRGVGLPLPVPHAQAEGVRILGQLARDMI